MQRERIEQLKSVMQNSMRNCEARNAERKNRTEKSILEYKKKSIK
jgi:hypothetical protein